MKENTAEKARLAREVLTLELVNLNQESELLERRKADLEAAIDGLLLLEATASGQ